jgi:hypothetical protein
MGDVFRLQGSYGTEPSESTTQSLDPSIATPISEVLSLAKKLTADYELAGDTPQQVALGGLTGANVLVVSTDEGRKVVVRITSADGATQSIPVEGAMLLMTASTPITAIDLTRVTGISTTVHIFLGQAA